MTTQAKMMLAHLLLFAFILHQAQAQNDDITSCEHYYSYKCYACKEDVECNCDDNGENVTLPCVSQPPYQQKYLQLIDASDTNNVQLRCTSIKTVNIESLDGMQNLCRCTPWNATVNQCPGPYEHKAPVCPAPPTTTPVTCPTVPPTTTTATPPTTKPPPPPVCHCTFNFTQPEKTVNKTTTPPPKTTATPITCPTLTPAAPVTPRVCPPCLTTSDAESLFQKFNASFISAGNWSAAPPNPPDAGSSTWSSEMFLMLVVFLLMVFSVGLQLLIVFRKPKKPEKITKDNTINMLSVYGPNRTSLGDDDNDDRF